MKCGTYQIQEKTGMHMPTLPAGHSKNRFNFFVSYTWLTANVTLIMTNLIKLDICNLTDITVSTTIHTTSTSNNRWHNYSFKGRLSLKQYMKAKPTKWGIKVFVLSDATNGYIYRLQIHTGKDMESETNIGLCSRIILDDVWAGSRWVSLIHRLVI